MSFLRPLIPLFWTSGDASLGCQSHGGSSGLHASPRLPLLAIIAISDLRHGLKFDCNQEASPVKGARPLIDFYASYI